MTLYNRAMRNWPYWKNRPYGWRRMINPISFFVLDWFSIETYFYWLLFTASPYSVEIRETVNESKIMKFVFVVFDLFTGFWVLTEYGMAVNSCVPKKGYLPASSRLFHLIWLPIAYRSVSMSHTVNTTWISSVDFKLGQNTSRADRYSIIYVLVDLAITIAQSQRHQSVSSCEKSRLGNRMFFSEKIVVAIVMFKSSPNWP